jgi:hypothetical protein
MKFGQINLCHSFMLSFLGGKIFNLAKCWLDENNYQGFVDIMSAGNLDIDSIKIKE